MKYYFKVLKKYAVFSGRASRKEFWSFFLYGTLIYVILLFIESKVSILTVSLSAGEEIGLLSTLYLLATMIPFMAVAVRRLHDINYSGWWLFLNFTPSVGLLMIRIFSYSAWSLFMSFIVFVGPLILISFLLRQGQPGENRYGKPNNHE